MIAFCFNILNSYALTEIGAPKNFKTRPQGAGVVLIDYKLIECFSTQKEAEGVINNISKLIKHKACGEGFAHVLMADHISMLAGEDKTISKNTKIPYIVHEPYIYTASGHFKVKPQMKTERMDIEDSIVLSLSKVIKGHIKATIGTTVQKIHMQDYTAYYKDDETYVHQKPIRHTRVMTASETLKLGEPKIISGDMWVEGYNKNNNILPEHSRLWLELVIK